MPFTRGKRCTERERILNKTWCSLYECVLALKTLTVRGPPGIMSAGGWSVIPYVSSMIMELALFYGPIPQFITRTDTLSNDNTQRKIALCNLWNITNILAKWDCNGAKYCHQCSCVSGCKKFQQCVMQRKNKSGTFTKSDKGNWIREDRYQNIDSIPNVWSLQEALSHVSRCCAQGRCLSDGCQHSNKRNIMKF